MQQERCIPAGLPQQGSSSSSGELFVQISKSFCNDVVKHFLICPAAKDQLLQSKINELQSSVLPPQLKHKENHPGVHVMVNEISEKHVNVWMQRKYTLENIREMHFRKQAEYFEELRLITSPDISDEASRVQKMERFISQDLTGHWNRGLIMILQELISTWGIGDDDELDTENTEEVYQIAMDAIQNQINRYQETLEVYEKTQQNFQRQFAQERYLSRLTAVSTLQRTLSLRSIRTTIHQEMYYKKRFMFQMGGVVLNLFQENLSKLGRSIEQVDLKSKSQQRHTLHCYLPKSVAFMGVCVFGNKVYVSGGRKSCSQFILGEDDADGVSNEVYRIIATRDVQCVNVLKSMRHPRSNHGFVAYGGKLWAIGGTDGDKPISQVESYDTLQKDEQWTQEPSLITARSCAATVVHRGQIWVIGGRDRWGKIVSDIEIFNINENKWKKMSRFPIPIMLGSGISIEDRLYVVGGVTGQASKPRALKEIYAFNDETQQWRVWTTMSTSRLNHCTASYGDYLVVVGGHTLHNMVPQEVPPAVCYRTDSDGREEHLTPSLGSNKLGLGLALVGDQARLGTGSTSGRTGSDQSSSPWSSFSSDPVTQASTKNAQAFMSLFCPEASEGTRATKQATTW